MWTRDGAGVAHQQDTPFAESSVERVVTSAANLGSGGVRTRNAAAGCSYPLHYAVFPGGGGGRCASPGNAVGASTKEGLPTPRTSEDHTASGHSTPSHEDEPDYQSRETGCRAGGAGQEAESDHGGQLYGGLTGVMAGANGCGLNGGVRKPKGKKKLGRPPSFNEEDINWETLTPEERRKIRRRMSNRASAHRVRQRRSEMMSGLQHKIHHLEHTNASMQAKLATSDQKYQLLEADVVELRKDYSTARERWAEAGTRNLALQQEIDALRKHCEQHNVPPLPPMHSASTEAVPSAALLPPPLPIHNHMQLGHEGQQLQLGGEVIDSAGMGGYITGNGSLDPSLSNATHYGALPGNPSGLSTAAHVLSPSGSFSGVHEFSTAPPPPPMCGQQGMLPLFAGGHSSMGMMLPPQLAPPLNLDRQSTLSFCLADIPLEQAPSLGLSALGELMC